MRRITIRLLGPFEVTIDGAPVSTFAYAKVRALLAYLAVEQQHPHPRAELATLLWPDQPERTARASLSQALTTLRNALDDKGAERPLLLADAQCVQLDLAGGIEVDVIQFLACLRAAKAHAHSGWRTCPSCTDHMQQALNFYRGHFLADLPIADSEVFEEWALLQREYLQQRALSVLERLAERAQWRGTYSEALAYAQRLVALEPLLEEHQRTCMRLLALNGELTAALAHYRQLRAMLAQELAVEPEAATTALFDQIRRGDTAGLQPASAPFSVPMPPTPLVNRIDDLQAICARLRDLKVRAVTITGTGGIGKTRLALEAAHALRYDFEDGVYFVELAALNDATLVADAIAQALGVKERPRQRISATLRDHMRAKQLLLVLDNFEHVVTAAPLVSELLAACPALTVLVTSRAALNIRAEQQFPLRSLTDADAVQLFIQRAQAAGAVLTANADNTAVYSAICRRLDGLPLAIELIAVRARTLAPLELLRQLERPLQALVHGPRDVPARHQALRNAIQWSYDLLDSEEQRVFMSLGVFAGGCTAEAAQAVLGESITVLPVLESLHGASLLQQQTVADETRFLMLETIREFALEQLTTWCEAKSTYDHHMEYYARFSMAADVELLRAEAPCWRERVATEQDNLRAAFRWALEHQAHMTALRIATGIWRFHWMAGMLREGLERLEAALAYREQAPWDLQANALRAAGSLAGGLSDFTRARQWLEAAVQLGRHLEDVHILQKALMSLGFTLYEQGDLETAQPHLEESIALARRAEEPNMVKFPLGILSGVHQRLGNYAQAQAMSEECLRINQACRDPEGTANALRTLATIVNDQGHILHAQELCEEALVLHRSLNHQLGMGLDYALLGDISRARGNDTEALAHYRHCLSLWRERENSVNSARVFNSMARTLSHQGDPALGTMLLAAAATICEQAGARMTTSEQARCDETLRACRSALGEAAFAATWAEGRMLTPGQAIDLALNPLGADGCPIAVAYGQQGRGRRICGRERYWYTIRKRRINGSVLQ
jgi:predicted ATPase/DNA-binding SARP family transcriptional activator